MGTVATGFIVVSYKKLHDFGGTSVSVFFTHDPVILKHTMKIYETFS